MLWQLIHNQRKQLRYLQKADEIGCSPEVTGQLYKILGMLCFDLKNMMMRLLIYVKPKQLSESILKYYKEKR